MDKKLNFDLDLEVESRRYRQLRGVPRIVGILCTLGAIGASIYFIFNLSLWGWVFREIGYHYFLIAFLMPLIFLFLPISQKASNHKVPWYDAIAALLAFCIPFYFFLHATDIGDRGWEVIPPEYVKILSLMLLLLVLEGARRSTGNIFAIIVFVFGCIPLFAADLPAPFAGQTFSFWRVVTLHALGSESLVGLPITVVGSLLIGFLLFAVGLVSVGGGTFFFGIALSIMGRFRGGAAKVAVIASSVFGMISGSVIANILVDGPITIPTMKKAGYPGEYAAAVETVASTGGVLMPPIMGATAFLLAQFLGVPYVTVAIAAFVPSSLYYFALFMQIDSYAAKRGLKGLPRENLPSVWKTLAEGWFFLLSFLMLLWALFYVKMEGQAPFLALAVLFLVLIFRKRGRFTHRDFFKFLEKGAGVLCDIIAVMLGVGLIIGALSVTGISGSFSSAVCQLAGDNIFLLLVLAALTSFMLGMGMTVSACYVILAVLLAPSMVKSGLDPIASHLFILYWGMISYITPPVAVGAYAAAGIIGARPMRTAFTCCRLGICIFFVPFFFVLNPALILRGTPWTIAISLSTALIGIVPIAWGLEGYAMFVGAIRNVPRMILFASGILLIYPAFFVSITGLLLMILVLGSEYFIRRSKHSREKATL